MMMIKQKYDVLPLLIVPAMMLLSFVMINSFPIWATLTVAGLAMGMILFTISSGLTLVFGLMDVLNFGHGVFITLGAYLAYTVFSLLGGSASSGSVGDTALVIFSALAIASIGCAIAGYVFEKLLIKPVYGDHLKQILITTGGLIVGEELIKIFWGVDILTIRIPDLLQGSFSLFETTIVTFRLFALVFGAVIFLLQWQIFTRTKVGLLIRAGVSNREMVEALGYRTRTLFVGTFIAGSVLAGLGGVMWGMYQQSLVPQLGTQLLALIFVVVVIGGLGSVWGALLGATIVGLAANYSAFLSPTLALFSTLLVMIAVLMWRPQGMYGQRQ